MKAFNLQHGRPFHCSVSKLLGVHGAWEEIGQAASGGDLGDLESTNDVVQLHGEDIMRLLFEAGPRRVQRSVPVDPN